MTDPTSPDVPEEVSVGPDVRPVIHPVSEESGPEQVIDPLEAIDPVTGLRVHSLQPRTPRTRGGKVYLAVLLVAASGIGLVLAGLWRAGTTVVGVAFLVATIGRIILPDGDAGMLKLRRKGIDVPTLLAIGTALVALAAVIPEQPGP